MIQPDKQQYPKVMFGVSTEQNTTNVLPALQLGVEEFCFLESETAKKNHWSLGATSVLKEKGVNVLEPIIFNNAEGADIENLTAILLKGSGNEPVLWNLGGGQKSHQIAIWNAMVKRMKNGIVDLACYANKSTNTLDIIRYSETIVEQYALELSSTLSIEEVLRIFGYKIHGNKEVCIYRKNEYIECNEVQDFMSDQVFRNYLFRLAGLLAFDGQENPSDQLLNYETFKNLLENRRVELANLLKEKVDFWRNWMIKQNKIIKFNDPGSSLDHVIPSLRKLIEKDMPISFFRPKMEYVDNSSELIRSIFPADRIPINHKLLHSVSGQNKFSFYFESLVTSRLRNHLLCEKHKYIEAFANLTISNERGKHATAEYDVLCINDKGELHAFDAKTIDFKQKDNDARLYNLTRASGKFVKFATVFPYDPLDINEDWFPRQLQKEPFRLSERETPFYVIADSQDEDFDIYEEDGEVKLGLNKNLKTGVRCGLLKNAFKNRAQWNR